MVMVCKLPDTECNDSCVLDKSIFKGSLVIFYKCSTSCPSMTVFSITMQTYTTMIDKCTTKFIPPLQHINIIMKNKTEKNP